MKTMNSIIEKKLQSSLYVCLIIDMWTNRSNSDFVALAASCINFSGERELLIIDMAPMNGPHSAENLKLVVEQMINRIDFNKSKIKGLLK
jgi:hypothetical protein